MRRLSWRRGALLGALLLTLAAPLAAQDGTPEDIAELEREAATLTVEGLQARLAELDAGTELSAGDLEATRGLLKQAIERLEQANERRRQAAEDARLAAEAPASLQSIRAELARPLAEPKPEVPEGATVSQIERIQERVRADLEQARDQLNKLRAESGRRSERRTQLNDLIARLEQERRELDEQLLSPFSAFGAADLSIAQRLTRLAQRRQIVAEMQAAETEISSYDARRELLPARVDRASRRVTELERLAAAWQGVLAQRRQQEADAAAKEAAAQRRLAVQQNPAVKPIADEYQSLADRRAGPEGLLATLTALDLRTVTARGELDRVQARRRSLQRKVSAAGLSNAMGLLLRKQLDALPDVSKLRRDMRLLQERMAQRQYELVLLEEERADAGDIEGQVQELLGKIPASPNAEERANLELGIRDLLDRRRKLLDTLIVETDQAFNKLVELEGLLRKQLNETQELRTFIEERILWVRSVTGETLPSPERAWQGWAWLTAPKPWGRAIAAVPAALAEHWLEASLWVLGLLLVWALRLTSGWRVRRLAPPEEGTDGFRLTLQAIAWTAARALAWPTTLGAVAWALTTPIGQPEPVIALAATLRELIAPLLVLELLAQTALWGGLAEAHWLLPQPACRALRWQLRWFTPALLVSLGLVRITELQHADPLMNETLGRFAFFVEEGLCAAFLIVLLRPAGVILAPILSQRPESIWNKLRGVGYPLTCILPIGLALLSLRGFHATAQELQWRLMQSFGLVVLILAVHATFLRWLRVAARRAAQQQREAELAAARAAELAAAGASGSREVVVEDHDDEDEPESTPPAAEVSAGADAPPPVPQGAGLEGAPLLADKVDIPAISEQAQQLVRSLALVVLIVGAYGIWYSVLPALKRLDQVQIWPQLRILEADEAEPAPPAAAQKTDSPAKSETPAKADAPPPTPTAPLPMVKAPALTPSPSGERAPVTLADLGLAILLVIATLLAGRNLPALIEIALMQRASIDAGVRYAASTLTRYLISVVGFTTALGTIGITWQSVQWLAAALTFGLAFGLQEVFANFISGIILLFERPIRVGDVVTVGDLSGTVTRIRIRATTVRNFDRKELIIPNKSFVTGQVLNWGLTDTILRVVIPVGVAYGSDPAKVQELLLSVARAHPDSLADPEPTAFFTGFGDSALTFELRFFIGNLSVFATTRHAVLQTIAERFREQGIEIAFPQRDLHLRSVPPGLFPPANPKSEGG